MFRIKICGLTTLTDAQLTVAAGAEAVGLNFYANSPRCVTPGQAAAISSALPPEVERVGVFVDHAPKAILRIADQAELTAIQLHGDDSPTQAAAVLMETRLRVYLALRCRDANLGFVAQYLASLQSLARLPDAILLDAYQPGSFGGTGLKLDWDAVRNERRQLAPIPLILAGGLNPANVAEAIGRARPDAVDVASGVESSPGRKDAALVREFVAAARDAFGHNSAR